MKNSMNAITSSLLVSSLAFFLLATAIGCLPGFEESAAYEEGWDEYQDPFSDPSDEDWTPAVDVPEDGYYWDDARYDDDYQRYDENDFNESEDCDVNGDCLHEEAVDAGS